MPALQRVGLGGGDDVSDADRLGDPGEVLAEALREVIGLLSAAIDRLQNRRCETCRHWGTEANRHASYRSCLKLGSESLGTPVRGWEDGHGPYVYNFEVRPSFGCNLWEPKEEA